MSEPIDISVRVRPGMPIWPESAGFQVRPASSTAAGDDVNVSTIEMDVHCGTHVEGPLHFIHDGAALDTIPLDVFVGPAHVLHLPDAIAIGPGELAAVPPGTERLLVRTRNSERWAVETSFIRDNVALTLDGARWVADQGLRLVGVDYLSVQRFGDDPEIHRIMLRAGVTILEGIDLSAAAAGAYRLTCLPLRLDGVEASPVRAVLERLP